MGGHLYDHAQHTVTRHNALVYLHPIGGTFVQDDIIFQILERILDDGRRDKRIWEAVGYRALPEGVMPFIVYGQ